MKKLLQKYYQLIIILLLATALRITSLFTRGDFWFDEKFSIHFSSLPSWTETWKYWVLETNPPLYTLFLRFYLPFVDRNNEILTRLPSLIFGLATIALVYIFTEKMLSKKAAIISSTLLAFSVVHIFASVETRVYALLTLLTTASFFVLYQIIFEQKENKKMWAIYTILNILLIYSHLTSLAVILVQFLILQFSSTKKQTTKNWFICQFISFVLWSVWFLPAVISKLNLNLGNSWFFENPGTLITLLLYPILNITDNNFLNTFFIIFLFIGFYIFAARVKETKDPMKRNTLLFIATWALLPVILSAMVGSFTVKYIVISYPAIFMLIASMLEKYITGKKSFLAFMMFIVLIFAPPTIRFISEPIFSWAPINDYVKKNETDKSIILISFIQELDFKPQYRGNTPIISLYLNEDNLALEERIVRYNWQLQMTTKKELYDWILSKTLNQNGTGQTEKNGTDKIFLLNQYNKFKIIEDVLLENHWSRAGQSPTAGLEYNIIEFNAPNYQTTSSTGLPANR